MYQQLFLDKMNLFKIDGCRSCVNRQTYKETYLNWYLAHYYLLSSAEFIIILLTKILGIPMTKSKYIYIQARDATSIHML